MRLIASFFLINLGLEPRALSSSTAIPVYGGTGTPGWWEYTRVYPGWCSRRLYTRHIPPCVVGGLHTRHIPPWVYHHGVHTALLLPWVYSLFSPPGYTSVGVRGITRRVFPAFFGREGDNEARLSGILWEKDGGHEARLSGILWEI